MLTKSFTAIHRYNGAIQLISYQLRHIRCMLVQKDHHGKLSCVSVAAQTEYNRA